MDNTFAPSILVPSGIIAIIPARGVSVRLPRKNVRPLGGLPLIAHTILAARNARYVTEVIVSTDDQEIAETACHFGASVSWRPDHLCRPAATSEAALLDVLNQRCAEGHDDPPLLVFLQCTSPLRRPSDIDSAIEHLLQERGDTLFSASRWAGYLWQHRPAGPEPLNYSSWNHQRFENIAPQYRQNGSIFVLRPEILRKMGTCLGGRIVMYEMDLLAAFEITDLEDFQLLEALYPMRQTVPIAQPIHLIAFDFDGVFTDNAVYVTDDGRESVRCQRDDGWGIAKLKALGIPMVVLSTERNAVVSMRCEKLGLMCLQGLHDKASVLTTILEERKIAAEFVAYIGNDENDLGCLRLVGLPVVPADADRSVMPLARLVLSKPGGRGAVREFCEILISWIAAKAQGCTVKFLGEL